MPYRRIEDEIIDEIIGDLRKKRGAKCTRCGHSTKQSQAKADMFICQNKICKRRFNPWEDTIFYQSKISKKEILLILELWTQKTPKIILHMF
ncbi:hypothetical protein ENBRE01_0069 [Enteropsectra breve]|nr:hypothetical protein ENBRE01_0069 [Enteropsectra breve]